MNNDDGIILQMQEDGFWGIKEEPYCTVEFQTKEDYEKLEEMLEKQIAKKIDHDYLSCNSCDGDIEMFARLDIVYCPWCGQKLDWRVGE